MIVMTGGRGCWFILVVAVVEQRLELDLLLLTGLDEHDVGADLEGEQLHLLVGEVIVAVTISPLLSRKRTTSADVRFSFGPNSWADTPRSMTTVPSGTGASLRV